MPDRLTWAEIRRLALRHRKGLILANLIAVLATLCSVPIPLLLPLLVDEVLLKQGDAALRVMDRFLPADWQSAAGYIGLMLVLTLALGLAQERRRLHDDWAWWDTLSAFALAADVQRQALYIGPDQGFRRQGQRARQRVPHLQCRRGLYWRHVRVCGHDRA